MPVTPTSIELTSANGAPRGVSPLAFLWYLWNFSLAAGCVQAEAGRSSAAPEIEPVSGGSVRDRER